MPLDWDTIISPRCQEILKQVVATKSLHWQDRDDNMQDATVALYERKAEYDPSRGASFDTWFRGMCNYAVLDVFRSRQPAHRDASQETRNRAAGVQYPKYGLDKAKYNEAKEDDRPKRLEVCDQVSMFMVLLPEQVQAFVTLRFNGITHDYARDAAGLEWAEFIDISRTIHA